MEIVSSQEVFPHLVAILDAFIFIYLFILTFRNEETYKSDWRISIFIHISSFKILKKMNCSIFFCNRLMTTQNAMVFLFFAVRRNSPLVAYFHFFFKFLFISVASNQCLCGLLLFFGTMEIFNWRNFRIPCLLQIIPVG